MQSTIPVTCQQDHLCTWYDRASTVTDVVNSVALFTAGDSFYVGIYDPTNPGAGGVSGIIRLSQVGGLEGANFVRFINYDTFPGS